MKIMICETCGKPIHRDERCLHCGGTGMYPAEYEFTVHEAATGLYEQMNELLLRRAFDKVLALSEQALEWMGFTGEIYWIRLLARRECATDRELLIRGADLEHSADYYNAIKYAGAEEHQVYMDVREKMDALKAELLRAVKGHYRAEKQAMELMETSEELKQEILKAQQTVTELWEKLNDTEHRIRSLETDCRMALLPHRRVLKNAASLSETARKQINQMNHCSEEEFRSMQLQLAAAMEMSEESAGRIRKMTGEHPWKEECRRLEQEQEQYASGIRDALAELKKHTARAKNLADALEKLETEEQALLAALEAGDHEQTQHVLTGEEYNAALAASGIAV